MVIFLALLAGMAPIVPAALFLIRRRHMASRTARNAAMALGGLNAVLGLLILGIGLTWLLAPQAVEASGLVQETAADQYRSLAAAIAVSVGSISAGYAVSTTGSAAIVAIAERPEVFGRGATEWVVVE